MNNLQTHINNYLEHCRHQKRLDSKTLKAYRIDLQQFYAIFSCRDVSDITPDLLENYIGSPEVQTQNRKKKDCLGQSSFSLPGI